jgi:hypothetical protein
MRWLDADVWVKYEIFIYKRRLYQDFNPQKKEFFVRAYVEDDLKLKYDSIRSDTVLVRFYFEQVVEKRVSEERKNLLKNKVNIQPPWAALHLLSKIAYPEAYNKIKGMWYQQNKLIFKREYTQFSDLFTALLIMNNHEAQLEFDKIIETFVKTKGEMYDHRAILSCLRSISNAYAVKKILKILPVKKKVVGLSGGNGTTYTTIDRLVFSCLREIFVRNNMDMSFFSYNNIDDMQEIIYAHYNYHTICGFIKQKEFAAQEEYRFLVLSNQKPCFRSKNGRLIPFLAVKLCNEKLPIRSIIMGPKNHDEYTKTAVRELLKNHCYSDVGIEPSNLFLR